MQASMPKGPAISPGQKLALVVQFTQPDGKILVTEGQGKGKVLWQDLTVTASVVTADQKGNVRLPGDPRISDGKTAHVTITFPPIRISALNSIFPSPTITTSSQIFPAVQAPMASTEPTVSTVLPAASAPSIPTTLLLVATAATEPMVRMGKMEAMAAMPQMYKSSSLSDPAHILYCRSAFQRPVRPGSIWSIPKGEFSQ